MTTAAPAQQQQQAKALIEHIRSDLLMRVKKEHRALAPMTTDNKQCQPTHKSIEYNGTVITA